MSSTCAATSARTCSRRGNAGEGQNIFGSASMTGTSIAVLVKTPDATEQGRIHFHDIGDDLDRDSKLSIIRDFGSIGGITQAGGWTRIAPDANNDWLDQVDRSFERFPVLGDKRGAEDGLFARYSSGVKTQRDAWAYNASRTELDANMRRMIGFYNAEVDRYVEAGKPGDVDGFVNTDPKAISWTRALKQDLAKSRKIAFDGQAIVPSLYRPFQKQWLCFDRRVNEMVYQMPRLFPDAAAQNRVIQVSGIGARAGFSALMSDHIPCLDTIEKGQCFPLYLYEAARPQGGLFGGDEPDHGFTRRDAITDAGLAQFQAAYPGQQISKEDLFHYIYGLLHAPDYRTRFKNNLAKGLPRIPPARRFEAFAAFRDAGRVLGDLHVNFERADPYMVTFREGDHRLIPEAQADPVAFYRVKKMKFGGRGREKDKTTVIYNARITMENIPPAAYDYIVNGKAALDWVMERQVVKTDKASGILNDANDYANETMGDPRYPLDLFRRVITVSLETMRIVHGLSPLDIDEGS